MNRNSFIMLIAFVLLSLSASAQDSVPDGRKIYEKNCVRCHGKDGTRGQFGAKNLKVSTLSHTEAELVIREGKRIMPSWKKKLTSAEIIRVVAYIESLRITPTHNVP